MSSASRMTKPSVLIFTRYQTFDLQDQDNVLVNSAMVERTLLDQVLSTAFSIIPNNFTQSFAAPNIISVIIIAIVVGMAMVHIGSDLDTSGHGAGPSASPEMEIHQHHPAHTAISDKEDSVELRERKRGGRGGSRSEDESKLLENEETSSEEADKGKASSSSQVLELFKEFTVLSNLVIMWIVDLAPFCIAFLIAGSLAEAGEHNSE